MLALLVIFPMSGFRSGLPLKEQKDFPPLSNRLRKTHLPSFLFVEKERMSRSCGSSSRMSCINFLRRHTSELLKKLRRWQMESTAASKRLFLLTAVTLLYSRMVSNNWNCCEESSDAVGRGRQCDDVGDVLVDYPLVRRGLGFGRASARSNKVSLSEWSTCSVGPSDRGGGPVVDRSGGGQTFAGRLATRNALRCAWSRRLKLHWYACRGARA